MKKHLLFNQSFGTVGSPNQTDETLTRENRIGLMSYLHRTLMLLFAVLTLSIANIGMAWGAASTSSDGKTASGTITFSEVGTLSQQNTYWYNGLKFYEYNTNNMSTDKSKRWQAAITPCSYGTFTSGENWAAGAYEMTGLALQAHCLAINVSSACTIEVVVNMSGAALGQSNPVVPGNLKVFWDDTEYSTAYTSSNYKTGTAKIDTTWEQNVNGKYNRMKLSIPVSSVELEDKTIDVIKVSYTGSATGTPSYSQAFIYESVKIIPDLTNATINWAVTTNTLTLTPTISGSERTRLSNASTTLSLTGLDQNNSSKDGYSKPVYGTVVECPVDDDYLSISFKVADGYTFNPTSFSTTIFSYGTGDLKYKAVVSDATYTITSNELKPSNGGEGAIKFASGAFTGKALTGTVTIKLFAYGYQNTSSGKRSYIKSPIVISGTVAAAAPSCAVDHVDVTGSWHIWNEGSMALTATAYDDEDNVISSDITYQWYKGGTEEGNKIVGATSATYSKDNCNFDDAGYYYCKVSAGGGCDAISGGYAVKMLRVYVKNSKNGSDYGFIDLTDIGSYESQGVIRLATGGKTYGFGISDGCGDWYGNDGIMISSNCTNWPMDKNADCGLTSTSVGSYTFTVKFGNLYDSGTYGDKFKVSVNYPSNNQAASKVIYFDNSDLNWSNIYYRIGKSGHNQNTSLTAVPGTAHLYKVTTSKYDGLEAWHIANNTGWSGSPNSIYKTKTGDGYAITAATEFDGAAVTDAAITILPQSGHYKGGTDENNNCDFYYYNLKKFLVTHTATINATTNGSIRLNWTDINNDAQSATSTTAGLAHTCNLQVTAEPATGYETATLTVNGSNHTSGTVHVLSTNATIAATFSLVNYNVNYSAPSNGNYTIKVADGGASSATKTATMGQTVAIVATPADASYEFTGWTVTNTSSSADVTSTLLAGDKATTASTNFTMPAYEVTIVATFAKKTYTITYNKGTGDITGSHANDTKTHGVNLTLPGATFSKTGYTQTGWATEDGGSKVYELSGSYTANAAANLYPVWTAKTTAITLDKNNSDPGSTNGSVTATYGSSSLTSLVPATRTGYTIDGYQTDVKVKIIKADGTLNSSKDGYTSGTNWIYEGSSLTLYAVWKANKFDVTHTLSHVTRSSGDEAGSNKATYGTAYSVTFAASSGYTLPDAVTVTVGGSDVTANCTWDQGTGELTIPAAYVTGAIVITVTGVAPSGHTVTYNYNGATGGADTPSATGASVTLPTPTKDGYTFQGWYTSGGTKAGNGGASYNPEADITLYALWQQDACAGGGGGGDPVVIKLFDGSTDDDFAASPITVSGVSLAYTAYDKPAEATDVSSKTNNVNSKNYAKGYQFSNSEINKGANRKCLSFTVPSGYTATFTHAFGASGNSRTIMLGSSVVTSTGDAGYIATLATTPGSGGSNGIWGGTYSTPLAAGTYYICGAGGGWQVVELIFTLTPTGGGSGTCYYVTYNGNGADGGFTTDEASHASGSNVTVKTNGFTKTGYTFTGWKTEPSGGTSYDAGGTISSISGNMTLYAQWSECTAPTASWVAHPGTVTIGDGGQTYTISTDATNTVVWTIEDQEGATSATLSSTSGLSTTLSGYTTAGSLYIQAAITGDGIHYLSTPATVLRQRVVISAGCVETTLISATLSSCTGTGAVTGTPGGTSTVAFESCESMDGGYKMGKDGSYMRLALTSGNFAANDEVKITITKASNVGDGALHIYKYAGEAWTELGSVTAAGAGTYSYTLTETNVSTAFNTIGLYRTGKNQNPYVKALSVVRSSCSASKPSSVTVTATPAGPYAIGATPTLTVTATNAETYQWYSNTNNTASDGFLLVGETATTYSPSTAIAGTTYYYCVATNASGSTVSNIIEVTVNSDKSTPAVSWTGTSMSPNYGGGGYTVTATVSTGAWDGTLTTDMLTASDGVTLSGVSVAGKVITATYGVTETARSPLSFSLTLPETTNYTALAANKEITFTRCGEGEVIETTETPLPVKNSYTYTTASKPNYSWQTAEVGWLTLESGGSSISSTSDSYAGFSYRSSSGKSSITFYSELDAVSAVRIYIKGGGSTTLSKVQKGTTFGKYTQLAPSTDYDYSYSNGSSSIESREQAYIEITFKTSLAANTFVEITLSRNTYFYGVGLITGNSEVGNITTALLWATDPGATVNKKTTDANFRYEAVKASDAASQATLGTISYKSSNTSVATVSATGVVDVLSEGTTTITATLAGSGCYKKATRSYNLVVAEATCTDVAGTITASGSGITIDGNTVTKTDACANVTLTVNGHTGDGAGATYQWYKDGVSMGDGYRAKSATVTANGDYTVEVTNAGDEHCTMPATNTITITGNAISITKIVDEWYVKNGRRTPDIALATIKGTTSWKVNDGSGDIWVVSDGEATTTTGFGECGFILRDSTIYLRGSQDDGNEPTGLSEGNVTLTITAVRDCGGENPNVSITIHKQAANTSKPSIAFIVDGTSGSPVNEVAGTKTSSRPIWVYLSTYFDLTGCNAYWTNNEKLIRQYYSQFDAIVITDDPNTGTGPNSGKKYVNALGTMVDIRPILTMEAFVGKYGAESNWHIGGTPSSPNPRQYELKLQCKDHDIYADLTPGANFRSEEIGGETYYYVTMVDNSVTPYVGVADDKQTEDYPALQGFSAAAIKGTGLLGIGTISDGTLQGGVERQEEPTARMMILGIQHQAMAALTSEGKQIIKNAIEYLLKTNMEDVNDCSSYFIGTTDNDWNKASNWSSNKLPDASTKARILAPVTVSTKAHVAQLDIAVSGRSSHYNNGGTECSGRVTINPTGALIVEGQVRRTTNGRLFTEEELKPIQIEDMTIGSDAANGNGTLIFDNSEGESQAIVQYYSKANTNENDEWYWQYMAVPFNDNSSAYRNYYDSYLYRWNTECTGWEVVPNRGEVYPWVGYTITQEGNKTYTMDGTLVETGEQVFSIPAGKNLVLGNSWTAPIQVKQFTDDDFAHMSKNVYLFNTGYDPNGGGEFDKAGGRYEGGTYVTIPIHSSPYTGDSLISSLQAFIVYAKTGEGGGTFTLDYDRHVRPARSTDKVNAGPMHAPKRGDAIDDKPAVLKVWASGSRYDDRLIVLEREDFSTGLDEGWDGNKRVAGKSSPLIFAVTDNGREAVSAIPTMEGTLIGFWAGEDNEYTLHFEYNEEDELYLLDLDNNTYTPVNSSSTYVFTVPDKKAHNRFILTRIAPDPVATGVEETQASEKPEAKAIKFLKDEKVFIFVNGKLYDATGKVVK